MAKEKKQEDIQSEGLATGVLESFMTKLKTGKLWKCGTPELKARDKQRQKQKEENQKQK